jgi:uncharacterized membrane protein
MDSRAKFLGHSIHQMLIVFPLGLLATSIGFDLAHVATGGERWADIAFWMIAVGVVSGLVAALFGWIDWSAIPGGTRAKAIGLWHGLGNVLVMLLFAASWLLRYDEPTDPGIPPLILSLAGAGIATLTGWLGGELVDRLGVGVHEGAHVDAPNSLSGRPAAENARTADREG